MVYVFSGILLLSVAALCIKIILLKRSVREIADAFAEKTKTDTNTLIDVSVGDKDIRYLAGQLNTGLQTLQRDASRPRC